MIKWVRERSAQEKWMLALIVMLLTGIAVRWAFVKKEVGDAFRERFTAPQEQVQAPGGRADTSPAADSLPG